jgi:hypothetical protein
VFSC